MKRVLFAGIVVLLGVAAVFGWRFYGWIYNPNTQLATSNLIYIEEGACFDDVVDSLTVKEILIHPQSFKWVARRMQYGDHNIKAGRYYIPTQISNYRLIQKLRLGQQDAVDLVINMSHTIEELAGEVSGQLAMDSVEFLNFLYRDYLPESQYTPEDLLTLFIPNTYEVWWNVSPERLVRRMETEHGRFWNADRIAAAEALNMTPADVYTLASIVEAETQAKDERKTIAGVYLNRLREGIPLQADPTVRFALQDQSIRRILHRHLQIESPYNTYLNLGLPPGPIGMPTIHSIDAVLYPENHDYIFFCARPGYDGRHLFARTLSGHMANARQYQAWLDTMGIR